MFLSSEQLVMVSCPVSVFVQHPNMAVSVACNTCPVATPDSHMYVYVSGSVPQGCLAPGDLLGARALLAKAEAHRCLPATP